MKPERCKDPSRLFVGLDVMWWCMVAFSIVCKATDDPVKKAPDMRPILCGWLAALLGTPAPGYVAAFIDCRVPTWRHIETRHLPREQQYKAGRTPRPPEFYAEVDSFIAILRLHRIPCYSAPGWEADDVAATVVRELAGRVDVALVTLDHDWRALTRDAAPGVGAVYCWSYGRAEPTEIGPAEVLADKGLGVAPGLVSHMIALCGDGDNIKGVRGLGPTKARVVLARWRSVQGVLAAPAGDVAALDAAVEASRKAADKTARELGKQQGGEIDEDLLERHATVTGALAAARLDRDAEKYRAAIVAEREAVELGLVLATLDAYAPLSPPFDLDACAVGGFDVPALVALYQRLGFTVMAGEVSASNAA